MARYNTSQVPPEQLSSKTSFQLEEEVLNTTDG